MRILTVVLVLGLILSTPLVASFDEGEDDSSSYWYDEIDDYRLPSIKITNDLTTDLA